MLAIYSLNEPEVTVIPPQKSIYVYHGDDSKGIMNEIALAYVPRDPVGYESGVWVTHPISSILVNFQHCQNIGHQLNITFLFHKCCHRWAESDLWIINSYFCKMKYSHKGEIDDPDSKIH